MQIVFVVYLIFDLPFDKKVPFQRINIWHFSQGAFNIILVSSSKVEIFHYICQKLKFYMDKLPNENKIKFTSYIIRKNY